MWRNPNASLRWHYPDQVQRVFLTHATRYWQPARQIGTMRDLRKTADNDA
jgi:hypothetical protein